MIPILISSDFLQMPALINECIEYVAKHLQEVVRLPLDMNCLNAQLLKKLATKITVRLIHLNLHTCRLKIWTECATRRTDCSRSCL